jgi:hypothetical protein
LKGFDDEAYVEINPSSQNAAEWRRTKHQRDEVATVLQVMVFMPVMF